MNPNPNPVAMIFDHECDMPEHGSPTARAACCRPAATSDSNRFWFDARTWAHAASNTLTCLLGCSIGDFGMIVFLQAFYPVTPMWLIMALAMAAGIGTSILLESVLLHFREHFPWKAALSTAVSMSFLSMLAMEAVMNVTDLLITGGRLAVSHPMYWAALGISLVAGFLAPLPYNYSRLKKHGTSCH